MYAERLLPHDIEAEEAVIGSLLIDSDSFLRVSSLLKPDDFYRERNRSCFSACVDLFQRSEGIDQVTVARELSRTNQLDNIGGMAYLSHLISVTPTSVHAEYYAALIARASVMRKLIGAADKISSLGYEDTDDVDATLRRAEDTLFQVRGAESERGFMPLRQIYDQYLQDVNSADVTDINSAPLITGFDDLDQLLGGIQRSDMVILGARPGLGKSTHAINVCINAAKTGVSSGIFSLEMSREQLALRILASAAEVDPLRIRRGLLSLREQERVITTIGELSDLPVYIDDTPFQGIVEMRSKARRLSLEQSNGLDMVVIDYLQLIQGEGRGRYGENRVQEISDISRSIKGMARDLNIPVITCSQLSRVVENRPGHRPQLSDLRDSGSIEQDADIVMFIYREDLYYTEEEWEQHFPGRPYPRGITELIVSKHRHGQPGSIKLLFHGDFIRFESLPRTAES